MSEIKPETGQPKYLSIKQASIITGLHANTIRNYIRIGKLKAVRVGARIIRIEQTELENLFAQYVGGEFSIWNRV
jgi:excisionase family DNA binding protein